VIYFHKPYVNTIWSRLAPYYKSNKTCWTIFTILLPIASADIYKHKKPHDFIFQNTASFTAQFRHFLRIPQFILEVRNTASVSAGSVSPGGICSLDDHLCTWYVGPFICVWKMPTVIAWHYVICWIILFVASSSLISWSDIFWTKSSSCVLILYIHFIIYISANTTM